MTSYRSALYWVLMTVSMLIVAAAARWIAEALPAEAEEVTFLSLMLIAAITVLVSRRAGPASDD